MVPVDSRIDPTDELEEDSIIRKSTNFRSDKHCSYIHTRKHTHARRDMDIEVVKDVGILEKEIASSNRTIKIDLTKRAWGFPASVQTLLKVCTTRAM